MVYVLQMRKLKLLNNKILKYPTQYLLKTSYRYEWYYIYIYIYSAHWVTLGTSEIMLFVRATRGHVLW